MQVPALLAYSLWKIKKNPAQMTDWVAWSESSFQLLQWNKKSWCDGRVRRGWGSIWHTLATGARKDSGESGRSGPQRPAQSPQRPAFPRLPMAPWCYSEGPQVLLPCVFFCDVLSSRSGISHNKFWSDLWSVRRQAWKLKENPALPTCNTFPTWGWLCH